MASRLSKGEGAESVRLDSANTSDHEDLLRGGGELSGADQKSKENSKPIEALSLMNLDQHAFLHSGGDFFPSSSDSSDPALRRAPDTEPASGRTPEEQVGCEAYLSDQSDWGSDKLGPSPVPEIPHEKKSKEDCERQNRSYVNLLSVPGPAVGNGAIPDGSAFGEVSPSPVVVGVLTVQEEAQDQGGGRSSSPESIARLGRPDSEGLAPGTPNESEPSSDLRRDSSSASKLPFHPPEAGRVGLLGSTGAVKNWGILRNVLATSPRNQMDPVEGWEGLDHVVTVRGGGEATGVSGSGVSTNSDLLMGSHDAHDGNVSMVGPEDKENMVNSRGLEVRTDGGSLVREPSDVVLSGRSPAKSPRVHQNSQGPFAEANRLQGYDSVTNAAAETVAVVVQRMLNQDEGSDEEVEDLDENCPPPGVWINDIWSRKDVEDLDSDIRSALMEEGIDPGEYFKRDYTDFPSAAHYYVNLHDRLNDRMDEELIDLVESFSQRLGPTHPLVEAMKEVMAAQQLHEPCSQFSSGLLVDVSMNLDEGGVVLLQNEEWIDDRHPVINTDASAAPTIGSKLNTINTGSSSLATPPPVEEMSRESMEGDTQHRGTPETGDDTEPATVSDEDVMTTAPEMCEVRKDIRGLSWVVKKPSLKKGKLMAAVGVPEELPPHRELHAQTSRTSLVSHPSSQPQPSTPAPEIEFMRDEVRDFSDRELLRRETQEGPRDVYSTTLAEPRSRGGWCCCF